MHERALLDAIVAQPDDDAPRLVYADYLESRGDARGELVQLQCQLAAMAADDPRREALAQRAGELLQTHGKAWIADLLALKLQARFVFQRGFIELMSGHVPAATSRDRELIERAPLLSQIALSVDGQRDRVEIGRPPGTAVLERARELIIAGRRAGNTRDGRGPIVELAGLTAVRWQRLRSLRLDKLRTDPRELVDLLAAPALAGLEHLTLRLRMPVQEVSDVVESLAIPGLRVLDLASNRVSRFGMAALARAPASKRLTELGLDIAMIDAEAAAMITRDSFPALRRLSVRGNPLGGHAWRDWPELEVVS